MAQEINILEGVNLDLPPEAPSLLSQVSKGYEEEGVLGAISEGGQYAKEGFLDVVGLGDDTEEKEILANTQEEINILEGINLDPSNYVTEVVDPDSFWRPR
jgi:hypothetical protein